VTTRLVSATDPYVGYRPYRTHENKIFYGRAAASRELVDLCMDARVVVLHGASGVGKTSLIQAGAIPLFRGNGLDVLPVGRVTGRLPVPVAALPEHNPYTVALLASWSPAESPGQLAGVSIAEFVRRHRDPGNMNASGPTVAVIDRLDSVVHASGQASVNRLLFFDQLAELIEDFPDIRLVVCVRDESLPDLGPLVARLRGQAPAMFHLPQMAPDEAFQAIVGPLAETARSYSAAAAEELLRSIRSEATARVFADRRPVLASWIEPVVLQIACQAFWAGLPAGLSLIEADDVRRYADVDGAIGRFVAAAVAEVADLYGEPPARLGAWLRQTSWSPPGSAAAWPPPVESPSPSVVRALVDRHVIRHLTPADSSSPAGDRGAPVPLSGRFHGPMRDLAVQRPEPEPGRPAGTALLETAESAFAADDLGLAERQATRAATALEAAGPRDRGRARTLLGDVLFRSGRLDDARASYQLAAADYEMAQDHAAVGWLLTAEGRLLVEEGRYSTATVQLGAAVLRLPGELAVKIELARALRLAGNLRAAAACFGSVLTIAPDAVEALAGRGEVNAALHDYADALDDLDKAQRLRPGIGSRPTVLKARANALAGLGSARRPSASQA
jgi:Flp pilus assembly protein TadD